MKPLRNATPVSTSSPPAIFSTRPRWSRKLRQKKAAKASTAKAAHDKGNAEATQRIDGKQSRPFRHRCFRGRNRKGSPPRIGPDARRPAEGKSHTHQIGATETNGFCGLDLRRPASVPRIGVMPRKCRPITIIARPATIASTSEYARSTAPTTLALAPSATKTRWRDRRRSRAPPE